MTILTFLVSLMHLGTQHTSFLDDLHQFVFPQGSVGSLAVIPDWLPVAGIILFLIFVVIGIRFLVLSRRYPNNEKPLGTVNIHIREGNWFKGNISEFTEPLSQSRLDALKKNPELKAGMKEIEKLRDEGHLKFYQLKYLEKDENGQYPSTKITDIRVLKKVKED